MFSINKLIQVIMNTKCFTLALSKKGKNLQLIIKVRSAFYYILILIDAHDIGLRIHPDHHHLRAEPCLALTTIQEPVRQLDVLRRKVTIDLIVHGLVVEPVNIGYLVQLSRLLRQHRFQAISFAGFVKFPVGFPFLYIPFFVEF